jgi:hypothetical protein
MIIQQERRTLPAGVPSREHVGTSGCAFDYFYRQAERISTEVCDELANFGLRTCNAFEADQLLQKRNDAVPITLNVL